MRRAVGILILALVAAVPLAGQNEPAQEEPGLWIPEGYHLLSFEERKELSEEQLKAVQTENTRLLRDAVHAMAPEERQAVAQQLTQFGASHELRDYEKQYITVTQMMLMSASIEEKVLADWS